MAVKFFEILEDPYTNNTNEFVLIILISDTTVPNPSSPELNAAGRGAVKDPSGNTVGYMFVAWVQDYVVAGSLSDEAFAHSWSRTGTALVPPGYSLSLFDTALALQGTLEELAPFIGGRR